MYRRFNSDGADEFSDKFDKCGTNLFFLGKLYSWSKRYWLKLDSGIYGLYFLFLIACANYTRYAKLLSALN
jgi:hypothetical protein